MATGLTDWERDKDVKTFSLIRLTMKNGELKKFFKYLLIIIGVTKWWNIKSDRVKSDFFANIRDYEKAIEYDKENSDAWMDRSVSFNKAGDFHKGFEQSCRTRRQTSFRISWLDKIKKNARLRQSFG